MRIKLTHDADNERYVDGFTITFKDGRVLDIFISLKHFKTDKNTLFSFLTDEKDWMFQLWIFNVQFTDKESWYKV
jgi:hypothetical protein